MKKLRSIRPGMDVRTLALSRHIYLPFEPKCQYILCRRRPNLVGRWLLGAMQQKSNPRTFGGKHEPRQTTYYRLESPRYNYWRFQPVATWESSNCCGAQGLALSPFIPPAGGNVISLKPVVVLHAAPTQFLLNDQAPENIVGIGRRKKELEGTC
jgi:hypothetical protein